MSFDERILGEEGPEGNRTRFILNLFKGNRLLDIRKYYRDKKTGEFKPFFNLGPKNNWDKSLETKNIKIIEEEFSSEMKELGYL
ncbi:MAG: hypothetical protein VXW14_06835 [Candidatus Thermoplasmatota archaeon]|nr:hypothetical protein [Candidatus Thermoplasmatota archaeon]